MLMHLMRTLTTAYSASLDKRPMLTEMFTSGIIWGLGDLATQQMERVATNNAATDVAAKSTTTTSSSIDWRRTFHQTAYASLIWGPIAHKWYQVLDRFAKSIVAAGASTVLSSKRAAAAASSSPRLLAVTTTKLALEMIVLHPVSLLAYFGVVGTMNGEWWTDITQQLKTDFMPTYALEVALWTPLDTINFAFVPVRHQLLVVNCGCFVESIALSFIKNNGIDKIPSVVPMFGNANSNSASSSSKEISN